ncbi:dienelactone hydrolase [Bradyrhizobium sp. cir1]|uniref:dienelactone hydrolase family protein n=1 Tax=Bradyrhizobium sp. cir1 TaxID=1445730 RepID=UPI00160672CA|nr:dienelactone hydrolase family protein [Bradyrhizobium sp. cir1]MBB4370048.1 dienelactone hydrolase [Bradyrhizobium sp. cir1]
MPALNDLVARTELRPFESLTLTDQQFLTGDKNGKAVTLAGELRLPRGASDRLPAVILVHGSGGTGSREEFWAKYFNEMGIASFVIDSFSGRGLVDVNPDQEQLGRFNMVLDVYRAYDVLIGHPRIDPARIVPMGFSRGGQAVLAASFTRFQQTWHPGIEFAAYIPFYASCSIAIIGDTEVSTVPIRQFHGTADDYNPVAPCRSYFERLRATGKDAKLIEFPDAHHVFDNPLAPKTPTVLKGAQTVRACKLKEEPLGIIINVETGQPFTYADPCVQTDPHIGYNETAAAAAREAVKGLLQTVFRLQRDP